MKYVTIILSITMSFLLVNESIILSKTSEPSTYEVEKLLQLTTESDFHLSNWQITIKENREIKDMNRFINNMNGYNLTVEEKESSMKWWGDRQETTDLDETILIVRNNDEDNKYQISYKISSDRSMTENLVVANERIKTVTKDLFTSNAQYFSCIEVWKDGNIDIVYFLEKVKIKLDMTIFDEVDEPLLQTWTGNTSEWENSLVQDNKEINCQIAVRKGSTDRTTIKIGTPILINEY